LEVNGQLHAPVALLSEKGPAETYWMGDWMLARAGLDDVGKIKFLRLTILKL
jgi:hypothetical protein